MENTNVNTARAIKMTVRCVASKLTRYKNNKRRTDYMFYVDVTKIPKGFNNDTNLRDQNTECKVFKGIADTLLDESKDFLRMNKGITINCDEVEISGNVVKIWLSDDELHGIADGGHTYRAICENAYKVKPNTQFVKVFVNEDVNTKEECHDIALGLNSSTTVNATTIYNHLGYFETIKAIMGAHNDMPLISYRMNDQGIGVAEIISIMQMLNCKTYKPYFVPIEYDCDKHKFASGNLWEPKRNTQTFGQSYDSKYKAIRENKAKPPVPEYEKMYHILYEMVCLYDSVEVAICKHPSLVKYDADADCYMPKECIEKFIDLKRNKSLFLKQDIPMGIGNEFVRYVLQMFRQFIEIKDDRYKWNRNPFNYVNTIVDTVLPELVKEFKHEFKKRKNITNNLSEMRNLILTNNNFTARMWERSILICKK